MFMHRARGVSRRLWLTTRGGNRAIDSVIVVVSSERGLLVNTPVTGLTDPGTELISKALHSHPRVSVDMYYPAAEIKQHCSGFAKKWKC